MCGRIVIACGCVMIDLNMCGCVVIDLNVCGCIVIDLNACGRVMIDVNAWGLVSRAFFDVRGHIVSDLNVSGCALNMCEHVVIDVPCVWMCREWF